MKKMHKIHLFIMLSVLTLLSDAQDTMTLNSKLVEKTLIVTRVFILHKDRDPAVIKFYFSDPHFLDAIEVTDGEAGATDPRKLLFSNGFHGDAQQITYESISRADVSNLANFTDLDQDGYSDISLTGVQGTGASLTFVWYFNPQKNTYHKRKEITESWWYNEETDKYEHSKSVQ